MTTAQWLLAAFWTICTLIALCAGGWWAWNHACHWAARRIEQMAAEALARPLHHRDWNAEMMQLVAEESSRD